MLEREFVACDVSAAQQVRVNSQIGQTSTYTSPTQTGCYGGYNTVNCYTTSGNIVGGSLYSYDANADLRGRVVAQCMAERGFAMVSLPQCSQSQLANGIPRYQSIPQLATNACVAEVSVGRWAFVNP